MSVKNVILWSIGVLGFVSGAIGQYLSPNSTSLVLADVPFIVACIFLVFSWYYIDSEHLGFQRFKVLNIAIIGITIVAMPYYFFCSRGMRRGFVALGLFLLSILGYGVLQVIGQYAMYYLQSRGQIPS